jgi:hypothetical protein|tara:strand:+ start:629 stop:1525 length:897 start_codon:yes stop_codon:yes gene_type:complete
MPGPNPFTEAIRGLGDNVSNIFKGTNPLTQPSITSLFGFTVPGTPLVSSRDFFLTQMESWFTAIPMRTQWMVLIEGYPELLQTAVIQQLENTFGNSNNYDINQSMSILKSFPLNKVVGCLFAQGVDIPANEKLEVNRDKVYADKQRGFIPGLVSNGREPYGNLTLQFRETNLSFTDFVVRPWTILAENFGFVARPDGDQRNVSTNIHVFQFTRTYQKLSQIPRKMWSFYNCIPVSVDNKNLTYDQESLEINSTEWAFSNYAVANSLYLPVPDIINKIQQKGWKSLIPTISPFQKDFGT